MALNPTYGSSQWEEDQLNLDWVPQEPNFLQPTTGASYPGHSVTSGHYQTSTYYAGSGNYPINSSLTTTGYTASSSYPAYDSIGAPTTAFTSPSVSATSPVQTYHDNLYGDIYSPGGTTVAAYTPSTAVGTPRVDSYQGENPSPPSYSYLSQEEPRNTGTRASGPGFKCPSCDKSYPRRRDLERHIHSRHPQVQSSASEYVTCPVCGRDNMRRDNWQRHMRQRHPTYQDTSNIQPRPY